MSRFTERLSRGENHEDVVMRELQRRGRRCSLVGQRIMDARERIDMAAWASIAGLDLRHWPDIRTEDGGGRMVMVDAKAGHNISWSCLQFGLKSEPLFGIRLIYVLGDGGVVTPADVKRYGHPADYGAGCFYQVDPWIAATFDSVFGVPLASPRGACVAGHPGHPRAA